MLTSPPYVRRRLHAVAGYFSCFAKQRYETWTHAASVAKSMRRRHKTPTQCYSCRFCGRFHVGSAVRFEPQRINLRPGRLTAPETVRVLFESRA